jgi:hypothetical protein
LAAATAYYAYAACGGQITNGASFLYMRLRANLRTKAAQFTGSIPAGFTAFAASS